jgi:hypothetical protein
MTKKDASSEAQNVFEFRHVGEKIHVTLNGELIHKAGSISAAQETVRKKSKGLTNVVLRTDDNITQQQALGFVPMAAPLPSLSLDEKLHLLRTNARIVAKGHAHSFMAIGEGGLGKTWNTMEVINEVGLRDIRKTLVEKEVGHAVNMAKHFRFVKGTGSAKGLFRLLFENNGGLVILDDCDDLMKDKTGALILKTALDTLDERWITWQAEEPPGGSDLPREFEYFGRIIFLSNQPVAKIDQALKTRALRTDMTLTRPQIVEYMERYMLPSEKFLPNVKTAYKKDALALIKDNMDLIPISSFSARALIHACVVRDSGEKDWKKVALGTILAK